MNFFSNFLLKIFLRLNILSYQQINKLSVKINGGVHPKHDIMKYYLFFYDNIEEGSRVLDVGCGIGLISYKLARKAKFVCGIDMDKKAIKYAKKFHLKDNIEYILADVMSYEFKETFDYIILSNVLEHIKERKQLLMKLKDISNIFLIRVPMINRSWLPIYKKHLGFDYRLDSSHFIEYTLKSFQEELRNAGLKIESYSVQYGEIWAKVKK